MGMRTLLTTAGLALLGTITFAQSVTFDFDRTADFGRFRTYAWVRGATLADDLNHKRVVEAIEGQLMRHGLSKAPVAAADVLVAYHASFDRDIQIHGFASGWGGYRFGGMRSGTATAETILVGTLAVDIVDARSRTIVWRGMATKEIDVNAKPAKREQNIEKAAEKLFRNYPPRP